MTSSAFFVVSQMWLISSLFTTTGVGTLAVIAAGITNFVCAMTLLKKGL